MGSPFSALCLRASVVKDFLNFKDGQINDVGVGEVQPSAGGRG